ncbi:MAG: 4-hydroxyphenylpyruvate dioxygenase [Anaerolineales bacterium]
MTKTASKSAPVSDSRPMTEEADFLQIKSIDHVHFYVGNAKHAMFYWWKAYGFKPVAYSGLETGNRDFASYVLQSGQARFVISAPYAPTNEIAAHHMVHGDGVKVIALEVEDVEKAWKETTSRGGKSAWSPREQKDDFGIYRTSAIYTYGETLHVFVDRDDYKGIFAPTYRPIQNKEAQSVGLAAIDHIVGNVQLGKMNEWVNFYHKVMGFRQLMHFDDKDISTEYSALMSKVMSNGNGRVKFPINEPAEGKKKSQIEEYLDYYLTSGAQHIALITGDIIQTVTQLKNNGVEFLRVPETYYEVLPDRVGKIDEDMKTIHDLGILVDRDDEGYLLQIFSAPIQDRPTMFIEVIQRHGSQSFGKGNFKALFEALELEQEKRGNL